MLSIVIPVYNSSHTLMETFHSALNSGVDQQEIILIDDGSSDASPQMLADLQSKYQNVKCFFNQKNLGGGRARNIGISHAKYPLIFVLDSDDILVKGSLPEAIAEMKSQDADAITNSASKMFVGSTDSVVRTSKYASGFATFESLVSHQPNPVIGNMLFTRDAYLRAGGYPEHHGFDTQSFGFRMLSNLVKVYVGSTFMYYQRLPAKPSYYVREARSGNINKNWFYIFVECLYKFSPAIRDQIINFACSNPFDMAKGRHLFKIMADLSKSEDFFSAGGLCMDDNQAYLKYSCSVDRSLNIWCLGYELRNKNYAAAYSRLQSTQIEDANFKAVILFISLLIKPNLNQLEVQEFIYFFSNKKSLKWRINTFAQRVFNRLTFGKFL